ncbi:MAG: glycine--tRNA ligase subunit beta [Gammaproteobacteria bacterium]|nr:glycine--tRNA ligase subunit beta [Gammaproteobacteria bacterium]
MSDSHELPGSLAPLASTASASTSSTKTSLVNDLLVEIGTEELPPKALRPLSKAFAAGMEAGLAKAALSHGAVRALASPRRLAVLVEKLSAAQPERLNERRGPALRAAFDADGQPTKAALGFARSCGTEVEALERLVTAQGEWLVFRHTEPATPTEELVPAIMQSALNSLPIPKRMRWGSSDAQFVRPVRWVLVLFGRRAIACKVLGVASGTTTRGHRYHCPQPLTISSAAEYETALASRGFVLVDFATRRARIDEQVRAAAAALGGQVVIDPALLDEVTALTEWPVAISGSFDPAFLQVPGEALIATMKSNQKYFHMVDEEGALLPYFITVANLQSRNPDAVRKGNERVVYPRLADAQFFFETDQKTPLGDRVTALEQVVFQGRLGSLGDKTRRIVTLCETVMQALGADSAAIETAKRAASLCKCDLVTAMVGEFPELQGYMGGQYAAASGEPAQVSAALAEVYLPRFAGDDLPQTIPGMAIAISDRLDTLTGIFAIGQGPSGDKDPFALRRGALGVARIIIENALDLDLHALLLAAAKEHTAKLGADTLAPAALADQVFEFMLDRLQAYFTERSIGADVYAAVLARRPSHLYDFARRVAAVAQFRGLPAAASLAAANKRIRNILRQAQDDLPQGRDQGLPDQELLDNGLLKEPAERQLAAAVSTLAPQANALLEAKDYSEAMTLLAQLRGPIDTFFDTVRVMDDDTALRINRLALLNGIRTLFLRTADISYLQE